METAYTLIVVDAQPAFVPEVHREQMLSKLREEIKLAMQNGASVIFTEIPYFSAMDEEALKPTFPELQALVKDYPLFRKVQKMAYTYGPYDVAGGLIWHCENSSMSRDRFRVCGAHTGGWIRNDDGSISQSESGKLPHWTGCVFDVVLGLSKLLPETCIEVVQDACLETRKFMKQVHWCDFTGLANVSLRQAGKH